MHATTHARRHDRHALGAQLLLHPLYAELASPEAIRVFMRSHAFAVWDFQSLLKALQRELTCVTVPWLPTHDPESRRLVNQLVLEEESDAVPGGGHLSHFELYLRAMTECGADTGPVMALVDGLRGGASLEVALARSGAPEAVTAFVTATLAVAASQKPHVIAATFAHGREGIIPDMFRHVVAQLWEREPTQWGTFRYYLERHITHDADEHGPMTEALVGRLCGDDELRWLEAESAVNDALAARLALWDAVLDEVRRARAAADGDALPESAVRPVRTAPRS